MKKHNVLNYINMIVATLFFVAMFNITTFAGWQLNDGKYQYIDESTNQVITNKWVQNEAGYYYLGSDGYMITGWHRFDDGWRYFSDQGLMLKGWLELSNKKYFLKTNGVMITGWIYIEEDSAGFWYYFGEDGAMRSGWLSVNNNWYYLHEGAAFKSTWAKINDKWYHFSDVCAIDRGWYKQDGKYYYLDANSGEMRVGWIKDVNGNSYFLDRTTGVLVVNTTLEIDGVLYTFNENGQAFISNGTNVAQTSDVPMGTQAVSGTTSGYFYNNDGSISSNINGLTAVTSTNNTSNSNSSVGSSAILGQVKEGRISKADVIASSESMSAVTGSTNQSTISANNFANVVDSFGNLIEGSTVGPK